MGPVYYSLWALIFQPCYGWKSLFALRYLPLCVSHSFLFVGRSLSLEQRGLTKEANLGLDVPRLLAHSLNGVQMWVSVLFIIY